ncbi:ferritin-like protein [Streptomyces triculaminicus]|uniref:Ferritin-like protein n=1 Tax=Streptomyces triculaminicus TaxID=2816232 RepID=A0A939JRR6_9ACTN|nr:ferritin-like protein [Streptomyces triculaminicus]MBO0653894.1 ferritin-like protein [Streptomyces triculaminicus]
MTATTRPHVLREPPFRIPADRADLHRFLRAALALEHLTVPPYLTAMYTLRPGTNRPAFYAVRAVVLEEMLHMALVANLLNAVGGRVLTADPRFVTGYPALLPYSRDRITVSLRHFGVTALETFLRIEQPEFVSGPPGHAPAREDQGWTSIGQFYGTIREGVLRLSAELGERRLFSGDPALQVGPEHFYNSGGEIFAVTDLASALKALQVITEQGEGVSMSVFDSDDRIFGEAREPAHYFRFNELLQQRSYAPHDTPAGGPTGPAVDVTWHDVHPIDPEARVAHYPRGSAVRRAAEEFNDVYAQLLCVLETAFTGAPRALGDAAPVMLRMRLLAERLYRNPHPDPAKRARGLYASATYEVTERHFERARRFVPLRRAGR